MLCQDRYSRRVRRQTDSQGGREREIRKRERKRERERERERERGHLPLIPIYPFYLI
jgi:hypothetical protein